ncbi:unnamed protein product [Amoebophrya sp. A25]|nr:unnamed protein product [Amoebophrya sp. A25]|eukprot:GSA25T00021938001.1
MRLTINGKWRVVLGNSHLFWDPRYPQAKACQGEIFINVIAEDTMEWAREILAPLEQEEEKPVEASNDHTTTTNTSEDKLQNKSLKKSPAAAAKKDHIEQPGGSDVQQTISKTSSRPDQVGAVSPTDSETAGGASSSKPPSHKKKKNKNPANNQPNSPPGAKANVSNGGDPFAHKVDLDMLRRAGISFIFAGDWNTIPNFQADFCTEDEIHRLAADPITCAKLYVPNTRRPTSLPACCTEGTVVGDSRGSGEAASGGGGAGTTLSNTATISTSTTSTSTATAASGTASSSSTTGNAPLENKSKTGNEESDAGGKAKENVVTGRYKTPPVAVGITGLEADEQSQTNITAETSSGTEKANEKKQETVPPGGISTCDFSPVSRVEGSTAESFCVSATTTCTTTGGVNVNTLLTPTTSSSSTSNVHAGGARDEHEGDQQHEHASSIVAPDHTTDTPATSTTPCSPTSFKTRFPIIHYIYKLLNVVGDSCARGAYSAIPGLLVPLCFFWFLEFATLPFLPWFFLIVHDGRLALHVFYL